MTITIIIDKESPLKSKKILWDTYKSNLNEISLLNLIEENSDKIKSTYIEFIERLAYLKIDNNQNLHNLFNIKKDFSLWWTTNIFEKSFYKQNSINDILKLIALRQYLITENIKNLYLETHSKDLLISIQTICIELNIKFVSKKKNNLFNIIFDFKKLVKSIIPANIFSFINFIRFLSSRITFKKFKSDQLKKLKNKNLFCTYFAYINFEKLKKGIYSSDYWEELLQNNKSKIEDSIFLHIYFPNKKNNYGKSTQNFQLINKEKKIFHLFIENLFSFKIFFKVIMTWFKNLLKFKKVNKYIKNSLKEKKSNFLYILRSDFKESLIGTESLISLYYFYLFEELANILEKPRNIFYLFENQGWEKSFVYNIKKFNSNVYAITHATIRYWDLRFSFHDEKLHTNFLPNFYAANGNDTFKKLKEGKFPINQIKKIEAVRFSNLISKASQFKLIKKNINNKILILGDYHQESNISLSKSLNLLDKKSMNKFSFTLKEHPLRKMSHLLNISYDLTRKNIFELSDEFNVAIVANTTSAIVDLYLLGFKIISVLDDSQINLSPLKQNADIFFLKDKSLLLDYLNKLDKINLIKSEKKDFFYSTKDFNLWRKILD